MNVFDLDNITEDELRGRMNTQIIKPNFGGSSRGVVFKKLKQERTDQRNAGVEDETVVWGSSHLSTVERGLGFDRPTLAPGFTHERAVIGDPNSDFNPAAFALPPAGQLGRGTFTGPDLKIFDLSVMKNFRWSRLGELGNIQFRVEAFNLFNHANFGTPELIAFNGAADNEQPLGGFGHFQSTVTSSWQIQLVCGSLFEAAR